MNATSNSAPSAANAASTRVASSTRTVASALMLAGMALAASAFEAPGDGVYNDRIDWGVMMDLSGPTSASQAIWVNGFLDYMRRTTESGGINGRRINVLAEDSRYNAAQDKVNYEKLVTQTPVLGISGLGTAGAQVALAPTIRSGKVPIVGTYTSTKALSEPTSPMVYGGFCGYREMAQTGVRYFTENLKLKNPKVMVVSVESAGGVEYAEFVADAAKKLGGTSSIITMKVTAADVTPQVQAIIAAKPDFITIYGVANTAILTMKAMQQYGLKIPTFGISYLGAPNIFSSIGAEAGGNYTFVSCFTPGGADNTPGNKELSAYADKIGRGGMKEDINYVAGWTTAQMAAEAIARAGAEPTRAKLMDTMNKGFTVDTKGLSAPIAFTKDDHIGPQVLKFFGYDYVAKKFKAYGEYDDYVKYTK
ncbi:ABC transporter substrate-binding protein [Variovorax sp. J31P207]|uniref:ABC transporter substrate-binding protein n=1 Tax=Variovorax sp. J31P207 TaxID=3053510 RepID=UPI0025760D61|nr:ABC transporter substrate-binding protein [Variovorax sp. J31P207]MDM0069991.1 ABC transporter substrate-binding protein [Variovorax sp. J31P207]